MSLGDCEKCWSTPCECGYAYRNYSIEHLTILRDMFQSLIEKALNTQITLDADAREVEE
jgi:hypothetical protein